MSKPTTEIVPTIVERTAFDATRLRPAALCWRKALYAQVYGLERVSVFHKDLEFGRALHSVLECYDRAVLSAKKGARDSALRAAVRLAFELGRNWPRSETDLAWDAKKNYRNLVRAICWYHDWVGDDVLRTMRMTNGKPAIEVAFDLPLGNGAVLCAKPDAIVEFEPGEVWVRERKTTGSEPGARWNAGWSPNLQITIQAIIGNTLVARDSDRWHFRGVIIEGIQLGARFVNPVRFMHTRTRRQIESATSWLRGLTGQFMDRLAGKLPAIDDHATLDRSWPMNEAACGADYGCPFASICRADQSDRLRVIGVEFKQREAAWNPRAYEEY